MKSMKVELTMIEGFLGGKAGNPDLLRDYIASKRPEGIDEDELDLNIDDELENGTTFFNRDAFGNLFIYDYQIKGFFKDAQGCLNRLPDSKMPAFKKIIDGLIFVDERKIPIKLNGEVVICERPIRVDTPKGERVSIARSEEVMPGSTLEFTITCLDDKLMKKVKQWLDYGKLRGLGQWRNSGKGRFEWKEVK